MTYPILDENAARKLFESYKTNAFSSDDLVDVE